MHLNKATRVYTSLPESTRIYPNLPECTRIHCIDRINSLNHKMYIVQIWNSEYTMEYSSVLFVHSLFVFKALAGWHPRRPSEGGAEWRQRVMA